MSNPAHDPLYAWLCKRQKDLEHELDQTNRRLGKRRDELRWMIRDIKDRKAIMRQEKPKFVDYGVF